MVNIIAPVFGESYNVFGVWASRFSRRRGFISVDSAALADGRGNENECPRACSNLAGGILLVG